MSSFDSFQNGEAKPAAEVPSVMSLAQSHRWTTIPSQKSIEDLFVRELGVSSLVARVMVARGISSVDEARLFMTPSLERDWCDPQIIPGMAAVADRVERALRNNENIAIFGDFDVDGITSTCLLTEGLRALGGHVDYFIPRRFDEGYGLTVAALERVLDTCEPDVLITVDNGIAAKNEVPYLLERGIDVCVTDHHEPLDLVPEGVPVADPKLEQEGPSRELAGVGVALKLIQLLGQRFGQPEMWRRWTEVACLGTVSDMMPLTRENRALVAEGIAQMRKSSRPGFVALAAVTGTNLEEICADNLSFSLIPRLNAAGRMADPVLALELLLEQDPAEALNKAHALEEINIHRREIESELTRQAISMVEQTYAGGRAIVIGGEGWHEGVKGIVASRLVNKYHVPALLFTIEDGIAHGSGRSVGSINLFEAVEKCSDLLIRFGGHSGAVGVTLEASNLDLLRERLEEQFDQLDPEAFEDKGEVTAVVTLDELSIENVESLSILEPFGQGNKAPIFAVEGVTMADRAVVGRTGEHLRFLATDGKSCVPAIMFRAPHIDELSDCCNVCDIVFEAIAEKWQGRVKTKLMVKDIIPRCYRAGDCTPQSEFVENLFSTAEDTCGCGEPLDFSASSRKNASVRNEEATPSFLPNATDGELTPESLNWQSFIPFPDDNTLDLDSLGLPQHAHCNICDNPAFSASQRVRCELSQLDEHELDRALIRAFIGDHELHEAQATTLDLLAHRKNVLSVMATGRGKSLIFQIHAARLAVAQHKVSVFVFPLRALVFDQQFHMLSRLNSMGIHVEVLTGETPLDARGDIFNRIALGETDIVLTTPEFLTIHADKFALSGRIGFVVVDEAHHAGRAKSGQRLSYLKVPQTLTKLGNPQVLALTATADDDISREICKLLSIDEVVVDESCRSNLVMLDERGLSNREARLVSIVASGDKTVVYVNSREQSIALARVLRKRIPELGAKIAFYNAGLSRQTRTRVETAFRDGELSCIVSTSAFGEGVNIPNIRHVVLYHMPFGAVEFNQMSGRAGRDGNPAYVHLLFSARDARINERILNAAAPNRDDLVILYRALQTMWRRHLVEMDESAQVQTSERRQPEGFVATNADIALLCKQVDGSCLLDERAVSCGIAIFRELGFAKLEGYGSSRRIAMMPATAHVDLDRSIRYLEGIRTRLEFSTFKDWALDAPVAEMLARINRPITPRDANVRIHTVDSRC